MLAGACAHVAPRPLPTLGPDDWRADLAYFDRELPRRHKNAFHHVSRDSFEHAVALLEGRLPAMTAPDFWFGLKRITSAIGDVHTGLFVPTSFHRFPLALRWFGDSLRVVAAPVEGKGLIGGTLVEVGGVPIDEVERRLAELVSQDENPWCVRHGLLPMMVIAEAVHEAGLSPDARQATYAVRDSAGNLVRATLQAIELSAKAGVVTARVDTPLAARRRPEPLWYTPLAGDSCLFVSFSGYQRLAHYTRPLWRWVDHHPVSTLIVDLRPNGGGNYFTGRRCLVNPARDRVRSGRLRHVYALIGNGTLSAAMVNSIDFRNRCHATLLGEPIGERPNSYSERRLTVLPRSRIVVTYSVRYYKFQPSDDPPAVMPDVTIEPTWEEFRVGRDPVLEWALAHRNDR